MLPEISLSLMMSLSNCVLLFSMLATELYNKNIIIIIIIIVIIIIIPLITVHF